MIIENCRTEYNLIAIDLYSGCGGLTTGLKQAGFNVIAAVDIDLLSIKTYKANHPEVKLYHEDIQDIDTSGFAKDLGFEKGELDLLAGCPPCQGFSSLRTLNGSLNIDDPRNDLLLTFLKFVEDLMPKAVMLENVPGIVKDKRFTLFLKRMVELGYVGDYKVLDAADFNVPQRRRRLIYMAGYSFKIPFAAVLDKRKTVRDAISKLPKAGISGDSLHDMGEKRTERVMRRITMIPPDGGSRSSLPKSEQLECHKNCNGFKDVYGRMAWDDVAPTLTGGCFNPSKGRYLHPVENRAITMREAALLQGFPLNYVFPVTKSKSAIALMIGNALPPPFIKAHAEKAKHALYAHFGY